jgi:hypothetical protein
MPHRARKSWQPKKLDSRSVKLFCPILASNKYLPTKYASVDVPGGQNISPPVSWGDVPGNIGSFALSLVDTRVGPERGVHWLVVNISRQARDLSEGASGIRDRLPRGSLELRNSFGKLGYTGPQGVQGSDPHEYAITIYALKEELALGPFSGHDHFVEQIKGKVVSEAKVSFSFKA